MLFANFSGNLNGTIVQNGGGVVFRKDGVAAEQRWVHDVSRLVGPIDDAEPRPDAAARPHK